MKKSVLLKTSMIFGLSTLLTLQGCSTIDSSINAVSNTVDSIESSLQNALVEIEVEKLPEAQSQKGGFGGQLTSAPKPLSQEYRLHRQVRSSVTDLDNRAMNAKAKTLCEQGYVKLSQQAFATKYLPKDTLECATSDCGYQLTWHIRCQKVSEQPFSLFGKTQ